MGLIHIMERGGEDAKRFESAIYDIKEAAMEVCEIYEQMKSEFGERYGNRYGSRGYSNRDGMEERRGRDSMGRYR